MAGYVLNERDWRELQLLLQQSRRRTQNTQQRPHVPPEQGWAPDVYVIKTPAGGIPALQGEWVGTGTGTGTGPASVSQPGSVECPVYRVVPASGQLPAEVQLLPGITRLIYNLRSTKLPGGRWVLAIRDKFGQWFADIPTASTELLILSSASLGMYGYPAQIVVSGSYPHTLDADDPVWLKFLSGYIPQAHDVSDPVVFFGRQDEDAPDGKAVFVSDYTAPTTLSSAPDWNGWRTQAGGVYYPAGLATHGTLTTIALAADDLYLMPWVQPNYSAPAATLSVQVTVVGTKVKLGIYSAAPTTFFPFGSLAGQETPDIDVSTTGLKSVNVDSFGGPLTLGPSPALWWLGVKAKNAVTLKALPADACFPVGGLIWNGTTFTAPVAWKDGTGLNTYPSTLISNIDYYEGPVPIIAVGF